MTKNRLSSQLETMPSVSDSGFCQAPSAGFPVAAEFPILEKIWMSGAPRGRSKPPLGLGALALVWTSSMTTKMKLELWKSVTGFPRVTTTHAPATGNGR